MINTPRDGKVNIPVRQRLITHLHQSNDRHQRPNKHSQPISEKDSAASVKETTQKGQ